MAIRNNGFVQNVNAILGDTRPDLASAALTYRDVCVFTNHPTNLIDERRRGSTPE